MAYKFEVRRGSCFGGRETTYSDMFQSGFKVCKTLNQTRCQCNSNPHLAFQERDSESQLESLVN